MVRCKEIAGVSKRCNWFFGTNDSKWPGVLRSGAPKRSGRLWRHVTPSHETWWYLETHVYVSCSPRDKSSDVFFLMKLFLRWRWKFHLNWDNARVEPGGPKFCRCSWRRSTATCAAVHRWMARALKWNWREPFDSVYTVSKPHCQHDGCW